MLSTFSFDNSSVRVVMIDDTPWWVAKDVAEVLEYAATSRMLPLVDEEDKQEINPQDHTILVQSLPANSFRLSLINESGIYACIFNSTKPEAKKFKRWLTHEVIPQIRKTGKYELKELPKLAPDEEAVKVSRNLLEIHNNLSDINPRLAQALTDHAMSGILSQKALAASNEPELRGVVEIAEEMGYKQAIDISVRSKLGKFVAQQIGHLSVKEKRLCNGTHREIKVYPNTEEVKQAIRNYFS